MTARLLFAFRRGEGERPLLFGHRGVRGARPENTMAAFEEAAREGASGVELDVRLTGSGDVVVLHDPSLTRVTGGEDTRAVASLSTSELLQVDVGEGERPPLLSEVLAFCREQRLCVNVEVKHDVPSRAALVAAVARLLRAWDPSHPVLLSSFDPRTLLALSAALPDRPRAQIIHRSRYHALALALARPGLVDAVHLERTLASRARIAALHARALLVGVWTVNDPREARDLAELGVDSLITDDPGALAGERGRSE